MIYIPIYPLFKWNYYYRDIHKSNSTLPGHKTLNKLISLTYCNNYVIITSGFSHFRLQDICPNTGESEDELENEDSSDLTWILDTNDSYFSLALVGESDGIKRLNQDLQVSGY